MDRRNALIGLSCLGAAAALPAAIAQQQRKVWLVGFLALTNRPISFESHRISAFPRGMRELGYVEGRDLRIEWRFAEGKPERLSTLATELVRLKVDVIVTGSEAATSAAQKATTSIPIVMGNSDDPIAGGFVKDLARPGGNITGLSNVYSELGPKQLEILRSTTQGISRVAVLAYSGYASGARLVKTVENAAKKTGLKILPLEIRTAAEIENAFLQMTRENAKAVIVAAHPVLNLHVREIADAAKKHQLPSIASIREHAQAGGLMSYGQNLSDNYRHAAIYVDKILKGAKPADLPVELPTKLELVINHKTAKALGLTIPKELLLRADEVIE